MKNEPNLNIFSCFANIIKRNKSSLTKQKSLMTNYPQHDKIVVRTFHKNKKISNNQNCVQVIFIKVISTCLIVSSADIIFFTKIMARLKQELKQYLFTDA